MLQDNAFDDGATKRSHALDSTLTLYFVWDSRLETMKAGQRSGRCVRGFPTHRG